MGPIGITQYINILTKQSKQQTKIQCEKADNPGDVQRDQSFMIASALKSFVHFDSPACFSPLFSFKQSIHSNGKI